MLLDSGGFLFQIIHSPPFSFKKLLILIWSISWNTRDSSADAPTRFEPLSDLIILTLPLRPTNLLKLMMNESVLREYTNYVYGPTWQVSIQSTISLDFLPTILHKKWTKQVHPTACKWWFLAHSLLGKIYHFLLLKPFCQLLAPDTLQDDTSEQRVTFCHPKTWGLIWFIVMPRPTWATCSWHQRTTNPAILQDFGNNTGFCISLATADLLILPQTLNIPSSSINRSKFTMLLLDFKIFLFPSRLIFLQSVFSGQI